VLQKTGTDNVCGRKPDLGCVSYLELRELGRSQGGRDEPHKPTCVFRTAPEPPTKTSPKITRRRIGSLEHVPQVLIRHLVVILNLACLDHAAELFGATLGLRQLKLSVLRMNLFAEQPG
jgi:hypothetical protein